MKFTDITLSDAQLEHVRKYASSPAALEQYFRGAQVHEYISRFLTQTKNEINNKGRCWNDGYEEYVRQDGGPITQDDLDAVAQLVSGQTNEVTGKPGDLVIKRHWECDSSD